MTHGQIATVGRDGERIAQVGSLTFPIWAGKIYEQTPRKSDGLLQWRLIGTYGETRSGFVPSAKFVRELSDAAAALGLRFALGITQFQPVIDTEQWSDYEDLARDLFGVDGLAELRANSLQI